jgi:hypothetical protein
MTKKAAKKAAKKVDYQCSVGEREHRLIGAKSKKKRAIGNVKFANPFAEEAMATMRMSESHPKQGQFIDVSLEPWPKEHERRVGARGFTVKWARKGVGFGEVSLGLRGGKWVADAECMGKQFLLEALEWFVKNGVEIIS